MKRFLTVQEAADYLQVSRSTVWRWCRNGTLRSAFKIGRTWRIRRSEVETLSREELSRQPEPGSEEPFPTGDDQSSPVVQPLDEFSLNELTRRCRQESEKYRIGQAHEEIYCLELFRRAILNQDQQAWAAIYSQYQGLVAGWVGQYRNVQHDQDETMVLVNISFARFWRTVSRQKEKLQFDSLGRVLAYLKSCANSVMIDRYRQRQRQSQEVVGWDELSSEEAATLVEDRPSVEAGILDRLQLEALEWAVWRRLQDEAERVVAKLSWQYGLSPQEIQQRRPDLFGDVQRVYRLKRTLVERLLRDPEVQKLRDQMR